MTTTEAQDRADMRRWYGTDETWAEYHRRIEREQVTASRTGRFRARPLADQDERDKRDAEEAEGIA